MLRCGTTRAHSSKHTSSLHLFPTLCSSSPCKSRKPPSLTLRSRSFSSQLLGSDPRSPANTAHAPALQQQGPARTAYPAAPAASSSASANFAERRDTMLRRIADPNLSEEGLDTSIQALISDLLQSGRVKEAEQFLLSIPRSAVARLLPKSFGDTLRAIAATRPLPPPPSELISLMYEYALRPELSITAELTRLSRQNTLPNAVLELVQWLPSEKRDWVVLKSVLNSYSLRGDVANARRILALMQKKNAAAYTLLIVALLRAGRTDEAIATLATMREDSAPPNAVTYLSIFSHIAKRPGKKTSPSGTIAKLRAEMRRDQVDLTAAITDCIIRSLVSAGSEQYAEAQAVLKEAVRSGVRPDVYMYTSLINAALMASEWPAVEVCLDEMRRNGVQPDRVLYTSLVHRAAEAGQMTLSAKWKKEMQAAGFELGQAERSAVFSGILKGGKAVPRTLGVALSQLRGDDEAATLAPTQANNRPTRSNSYVLPATADGIKRDTYAEKKLREMHALIAESEATLRSQGTFVRGAQRNYNALVRYVARSASPTEARSLVARLRSAGFHPDVFTYTILLQSFARQKSSDNVIDSIRAEMHKDGVAPNKMTFIVLSMYACSKGHADVAERWVAEMQQRGCGEPDSRMCRSLLSAYAGSSPAATPEERQRREERKEHWQKMLKEAEGKERSPLPQLGAGLLDEHGTSNEMTQ